MRLMVQGSFGARVRTVRRAAGLTQQELADAAGFSRSSIANIEADNQDVTLRGLYSVADALRVTPATLLDDDEIEPRSAVEAALFARIDAKRRLLDEAVAEMEKLAARSRRLSDALAADLAVIRGDTP